MTLSASGSQVTALDTRIAVPNPLSYTLLLNRINILETVTVRRQTLLQRVRDDILPPLVSEDPDPVQYHTTDLNSDDDYVKMDSHTDYLYQNLMIWGLRTYVKAWIPSLPSGCTRGPSCKVVIVRQEYSMDLSAGESTFNLDVTSIVPIPFSYAYSEASSVWVRLPNRIDPYLKFNNTLVGVTLAAVVVRNTLMSNSRIHAHAVWPGGTSYVTTFKAP